MTGSRESIMEHPTTFRIRRSATKSQHSSSILDNSDILQISPDGHSDSFGNNTVNIEVDVLSDQFKGENPVFTSFDVANRSAAANPR